jgi:hypothetical protein
LVSSVLVSLGMSTITEMPWLKNNLKPWNKEWPLELKSKPKLLHNQKNIMLNIMKNLKKPLFKLKMTWNSLNLITIFPTQKEEWLWDKLKKLNPKDI